MHTLCDATKRQERLKLNAVSVRGMVSVSLTGGWYDGLVKCVRSAKLTVGSGGDDGLVEIEVVTRGSTVDELFWLDSSRIATLEKGILRSVKGEKRAVSLSFVMY